MKCPKWLKAIDGFVDSTSMSYRPTPEDILQEWIERREHPTPVEPSEMQTDPKHIRIGCDRVQTSFNGWHRPDLDVEHSNWHYYQATDGAMYHFRSDKMVYVIEENIPQEDTDGTI